MIVRVVRRLARAISRALGAVAVVLLVAEAVLRVTTPPTFRQRPFTGVSWLRSDPVSGWRNVAGFHGNSVELGGRRYRAELAINALGFRGPDVAVAKPPGTMRIVCQGDAGTFGWQLPSRPARDTDGAPLDLESYVVALRDALATRGGNVEVINAGVVGYSAAHGLRQLVLEVLRLHPDIVTVRFGYEDHVRASHPALRAIEPAAPRTRELFYALAGTRLLRLGLDAYQQLPLIHPPSATVPWTFPDEFERTLRRYAELSRRHGFKLLFLDYPLADPATIAEADRNLFVLFAGVANVDELYREHATYQQIVRTVAADEGVPVLDSVAAFRAAAEPLYLASDPVHPNREGSRLLATLLQARLDALGWLGR